MIQNDTTIDSIEGAKSSRRINRALLPCPSVVSFTRVTKAISVPLAGMETLEWIQTIHFVQEFLKLASHHLDNHVVQECYVWNWIAFNSLESGEGFIRSGCNLVWFEAGTITLSLTEAFSVWGCLGVIVSIAWVISSFQRWSRSTTDEVNLREVMTIGKSPNATWKLMESFRL